MAHTVHRDLPLLHSFQQSGLGAAGGPVELVSQKEVAHHRAGLVLHLARVLVIEGEAGDIRRHHIRRKLHPGEAQVQRLGKGQRQGGLAHAGDILQQDMAPGQDGRQNLDQDAVLADNGLFDLPDHLGG